MTVSERVTSVHSAVGVPVQQTMRVSSQHKLQALVYDILPSTTAVFSYAIGSRKLSLIVEELCESRGGRPGLSVLTSFLVSVDVKNY